MDIMSMTLAEFCEACGYDAAEWAEKFKAAGVAEDSKMSDYFGKFDDAIKALKEMQDEDEEEPEEEDEEMKDQKAASDVVAGFKKATDKKFAAMQKTIDSQATTIGNMTRSSRVAHYTTVAETFIALEGTPEAMAESYMALEEKAGREFAESMVERDRKTNTDRLEAGLLVPKGTKVPAVDDDPFEKKVAEYAKAQDISVPKALVYFQTEDPEGFAAYNIRQMSPRLQQIHGQ